LSEAQRFALRFFLVLAGFSVLAWVVSLPTQLGAAQRGIAQAASAVARVFGSASRVSSDYIHVPSLAIHINHECTGVYVLTILVTFLLAYPASVRARLGGMLIGITGLTIINVLRLSFLVRIAELQPALFQYFHEYVWQGVFLVLVIAYAMSWVEYAR
jgi:exosortase/archaeosortase family protein